MIITVNPWVMLIALKLKWFQFWCWWCLITWIRYILGTRSFWETSTPSFFQLVLACLEVYKLRTAAPVAHLCNSVGNSDGTLLFAIRSHNSSVGDCWMCSLYIAWVGNWDDSFVIYIFSLHSKDEIFLSPLSSIQYHLLLISIFLLQFKL